MKQQTLNSRKGGSVIDKRAEYRQRLITFDEERPNGFPECWIVVEYDAVFMHADAL